MPLEDQSVATTYMDQQPVIKDVTADVTPASSEFFTGKKNNNTSFALST